MGPCPVVTKGAPVRVVREGPREKVQRDPVTRWATGVGNLWRAKGRRRRDFQYGRDSRCETRPSSAAAPEVSVDESDSRGPTSSLTPGHGHGGRRRDYRSSVGSVVGRS